LKEKSLLHSSPAASRALSAEEAFFSWTFVVVHATVMAKAMAVTACAACRTGVDYGRATSDWVKRAVSSSSTDHCRATLDHSTATATNTCFAKEAFFAMGFIMGHATVVAKAFAFTANTRLPAPVDHSLPAHRRKRAGSAAMDHCRPALDHPTPPASHAAFAEKALLPVRFIVRHAAIVAKAFAFASDARFHAFVDYRSTSHTSRLRVHPTATSHSCRSICVHLLGPLVFH